MISLYIWQCEISSSHSNFSEIDRKVCRQFIDQFQATNLQQMELLYWFCCFDSLEINTKLFAFNSTAGKGGISSLSCVWKIVSPFHSISNASFRFQVIICLTWAVFRRLIDVKMRSEALCWCRCDKQLYRVFQTWPKGDDRGLIIPHLRFSAQNPPSRFFGK